MRFRGPYPQVSQGAAVTQPDPGNLPGLSTCCPPSGHRAPPRRLPDPLPEPRRGRSRVVRVRDGPYDDDPAGARLQHLVEVGEVDAADGEPGAVGAEGSGVPDQVE